MNTIHNLQDLANFRAYDIHPEVEVSIDDSVVVWHAQDGQFYFVNTSVHPHKPDMNHTVSLKDGINIPLNDYGIVSIQDLAL